MKFRNNLLSLLETDSRYLQINNRLNILIESTVTSTNAILKNKAREGALEGTVLIAEEQTEGRGRFTRSFYSPKDSGIYMSLVLRPELKAESAVLITTAAAVAVAEAVEFVSGKQAGIKWVNDVLIDNKKICGILTEGSVNSENGNFDYIILGMGINAFFPKGGFPENIKSIAGAVFDNNDPLLKAKLTAEILLRFFEIYDNLSAKSYLNSYSEKLIIIGKEINVLSNNSSKKAIALGIDENFRLRVNYENGEEELLSSGEISTKIL